MGNELTNNGNNGSNQKKGKLKLYLLLTFLLVIIFVLGVFANNWAAQQDLRKITITGNKITNTNLIKHKINDSLLLSNREKINLLQIKKDVQSLPFVQKAFAEFKTPDELAINVIERKPVAIIVCANGAIQLIDKECQLLPYLILEDFPDLPIIRIFNSGDKSDNIKYCKALDIINEINEDKSNFLQSAISEINYNYIDDNYHALTHDNSIDIIIGKAENLKEKFGKLTSYLIDLKPADKGQKYKYIDLRWNHQLVVGGGTI